jgi:hypothetical protein
MGNNRGWGDENNRWFNRLDGYSGRVWYGWMNGMVDRGKERKGREGKGRNRQTEDRSF